MTNPGRPPTRVKPHLCCVPLKIFDLFMSQTYVNSVLPCLYRTKENLLPIQICFASRTSSQTNAKTETVFFLLCLEKIAGHGFTVISKVP